MLEISPARSRLVRRGRGQRLNFSHYDHRQGYPIRIMVWGCMSWRGLGKLAIVEGSMNTDKYLQIMDSHLIPQAAAWFPSGDWIYQQDGARCHTSFRAMQYFEERRIPILPWTANSPDMNPMENIWSLLKKRVYSIGAASKQQLVENIHSALSDGIYWKTVCEKLIESMPTRIASVVKNKGGPFHHRN